MDNEKPLRCPLCKTAPILAKYGIDESGRLFVHVRVYKAQQVKAEIFIRGGEVTLTCTKCHRYHVVKIKQNKAILDKARRPSPNLIAPTSPVVDAPSFSHLE